MKREDAKELLPVIQAFAEGRAVEYYDEDKDEWRTGERFSFDNEPKNYRIKPEPECRPFESCDELIRFWESHYCNDNRPKGTMPLIWVKLKENDYIYLVVGFDKKENEIRIYDHWFNFTELFNGYTFVDGTPCGEVTE